MTPDNARICSITKEPCIANCRPEKPCWIERVAPVVADYTGETLTKEANGYSQLRLVSDTDRASIQKWIEKQAIKILQIKQSQK